MVSCIELDNHKTTKWLTEKMPNDLKELLQRVFTEEKQQRKWKAGSPQLLAQIEKVAI